jgi:uncharacterized protein (DUF433 family)
LAAQTTNAKSTAISVVAIRSVRRLKRHWIHGAAAPSAANNITKNQWGMMITLKVAMNRHRNPKWDNGGLPLIVGKTLLMFLRSLDYRNNEKDAARCGGQPVVAGTRIRVAMILTCYRQGMSIEEIVQQYSHLKPADVHDALAYAYDHLDEIEG